MSIVAAKAKDSTIGDPVGDDYLRLNGTSMATPHVAGSAALLAQQHPDWKAAELKAALMGSAKPAADQTAFEQGAGRVDVAQAHQTDRDRPPATCRSALRSWPHDDDTPVTKTLTYRNLGDQPVTLDLAASLNDPTGSPAPADALVLSARTVTVPTGGTATVQATSNTKHNGPDGAYSGRITATGGELSITSAIGVDKEGERYNLTVKHIGPDGAPSPDDTSGTLVWGLNQDVDLPLPGATATVRLPKGEYLLEGLQQLGAPDSEDHYLMVQPSLQLAKDSTVVLDARTTKQVKIALPRPDAKLIVGDIGYVRTSSDPSRQTAVNGYTFDLSRIHLAQVGTGVSPELMTGHIATQWGKPGADEDFRNTPYLYGLVNTTAGGFPTGLDRTVRDKELAVVDQTSNATARPGGRTNPLRRETGRFRVPHTRSAVRHSVHHEVVPGAGVVLVHQCVRSRYLSGVVGSQVREVGVPGRCVVLGAIQRGAVRAFAGDRATIAGPAAGAGVTDRRRRRPSRAGPEGFGRQCPLP